MKEVVLGVVWVATLAGAVVVGRSLPTPESDPAASEEVERLRARIRELEARSVAAGAGALSLEARTVPSEGGGSARETSDTPSSVARVEKGGPTTLAAPETLDLSEVESPEEAVRLLLAFAEARLAEGPEGHLVLLRAIDALLQGEDAKRLFDDEAAAARTVYPLLKFAVTHERQMVAFSETVFRTMAEDPAALKDLDDDALEIFTEGFAVAIPGAVDEETLERFRDHARRILEVPEGDLPKSVRGNRADFSRALAAWAPALTSKEAAERLRTGAVAGEEALALLRRVTPEDRHSVDVARVLDPLVRRGDARTLRQMRTLGLDRAAIASLDRAVLEGAGAGTFPGWSLPDYLQGTGRSAWSDARPFVEEGLSRGGRTTSAFGQGLLGLGGRQGPPPDWLANALATYPFEEGIRNSLMGRLPK